MELSNNQDLFVQAFRQAADGIIIVDRQQPDDPIIYTNPAFEKLTGYGFDEVVGKNCRFMQGANRDEETCAQLRQSIEAGKVDIVTLANVRKDGSEFWNELSLSPMRLSGDVVTHYIGVCRDASRHIQGLQALEDAHDGLQKSLLELNQLVITDPLTGLYNRRYFDAIFDREWNICRRSQEPVTLALIDIDDLKSYNDTFGHQAGDDCLVKIGKVLQQGFSRGGDMVARYGGEEFVVICPRIDASEVVAQVERVCANAQALALESGDDSQHDMVTASAGVASLIPGKETSMAGLFEKADARLYKAKERGRNQVISD